MKYFIVYTEVKDTYKTIKEELQHWTRVQELFEDKQQTTTKENQNI